MAKRNITTEEEALNAVRENGLALKDVPEKLKTAEVCTEAVKQDVRALQHVPWGQLNLTVPATVELCLEAVKLDDNCLALKYMPKNLMTASPKEFGTVCLEAVKKDGKALQYVPENLRTAEMCLEAVRQQISYYFAADHGYLPHEDFALNYVPEDLMTASPKEFGALCLEAVKKDGWYLECVPENLKTAELCLEAVKQNGYALEYVPENLKTAEIYLEAIKAYNRSMQHVPYNYRNVGSEKYYEDVKNEIERVFEEMPEELREEVRRRLESEGA